MINVYDILLNFNKELIQFYEWEENDNIKCIRKIPLIKVNASFINDILTNKIKTEENLLKEIENKAELYDEDLNEYNKIAILTDGLRAYGYSFNNNEISSLLVDEEKEILRLANKMIEETYLYKVEIYNYRNNELLTRKEKEIKNNLIKEFNNLYRNKKEEKLNYYYYEYFNKTPNDIENVYNSLIKSTKNINNKHYQLYEIINMFNKNK